MWVLGKEPKNNPLSLRSGEQFGTETKRKLRKGTKNWIWVAHALAIVIKSKEI